MLALNLQIHLFNVNTNKGQQFSKIWAEEGALGGGGIGQNDIKSLREIMGQEQLNWVGVGYGEGCIEKILWREKLILKSF